MKVSMCKTMRTYEWKNLSKDLLAGLVIMAVSIPISMGYAQIAGLPAVYGLYGSVFPIVLFALFSTSPQFVFGVDAAPAALVGSALVSLGIEGGSKEAIAAVPVLAFFVAVWLLVFYLCRAGKLVNYISAPVMGGFISGICTTIILMQVPKLFGGKAGVGELPELVHHIWESRTIFHLPSLLLGVGTLVILLVSKKLIPKSDGSVSDGSGCDRYGVFSSGRSWYSDACSSETGASHMDSSGVWSNPVKRGGDHQSFRGSCHHGRDTSGRKQFRTEKRIQNR